MPERKTVLITGCSSGIGRAAAQALSAAGHAVVATARRLDSLDGVGAELKLSLDVTDGDSVAAAFTEAEKRLGGIDCLVANAGLGVRASVEDSGDGIVDELFDVNFFGALRSVRAAAASMRRRGRGTIIAVSSIAPRFIMPATGAYAASKAALEAICDAARQELRPFGVSVSLLVPGPVSTDFAQKLGRRSAELLGAEQSAYADLYRRYDRLFATMDGGCDPAVVGRAVLRILESRKPRARYSVGVGFPLRLVMALGQGAKDAFFGRLLAGAGKDVGE